MSMCYVDALSGVELQDKYNTTKSQEALKYSIICHMSGDSALGIRAKHSHDLMIVISSVK